MQETVYAVVFFSILVCAFLVFVIESGRLDSLAAFLFRPFATAQQQAAPNAPMRSFEQSLGLPALRSEFQEPNLVQLSDNTPPGEPTTSVDKKDLPSGERGEA